MNYKNKKQNILSLTLAVSLFTGIASFLFVFNAQAAPPTNQLEKEPRIRAGLYTTEDTVKIQCNRRAKIVKKNGKIIAWAKKNEIINLKYNRETSRYHLDVGDTHKIRKSFFRIIPKKKKTSVCEIINYDNRPSWNPALNDNKFRERLEVRFAPETNKICVVNGLTLEHYIQGIGES